ncbi:MAG: Clp protease/crotonase-like domain-containing protein [Planctomycetota bacterium]|jgi:ATP-dependent protease ClpP protease subunit
MTRKIVFISLVLLLCTALCTADTFKHRQSGEVFYGFATQKSIGNRTRVYNSESSRFKPINLAEYDITPNAKGRRNNVVVIPLEQAEVMLSKTVSATLANAITEASNKGPKLIVISIDSPGGRGQYMRDICTAITQTNNCPIVAFISGGRFGGAYSAATAVAMACDKIYISPNAAMGSVAPPVGSDARHSASGYENGQIDIEKYSSQNLAAYKNYLATLAEKNNRSGDVAMAMVDRSIEIVEVVNQANGERELINRADKRPNQTLVRSWARTLGGEGETVLALTASDAIYSRMADKTVNSLAELVAEMDASDAKLIKSGKADKTIRKFLAAGRNLSEILVSADYLQKRADELEMQLNSREVQERQSTVQREYRRDRLGRRYSSTPGGHMFPSYPAVGTARRRRQRDETEIITRSEPVVDTLRLRNEISLVLTDLIRAYNRAIALARRWPGALPQDRSLQTLEKQLVAAKALQNDIIFRRSGGTETTGGGATPVNPLNRSRGYSR